MTGDPARGDRDDRPAVAPDGGTAAEAGAGSWPSQNNCVNPTADAETAVEEDEDVRPTPIDRAEEFAREYPHLAQLPLTETHGRPLRREVTEADYEAEFVEPVTEEDDAHVTYRLKERRAATWQDAVFAFLDAHERYEMGMKVRFSGTDPDGESVEFEVELQDSWGESYANKEYARAMATDRQLAGGEHPDGTQIEGLWDDLVTVMLTFTGSSVPDGDRVSPVDHFDPVSDSWSYNGVRDTVRNICENDLGLESDEWEYLRFAEPHGVGNAADLAAEPSPNACYSHNHVGLYLDLDIEERYGVGDQYRPWSKQFAERQFEKAFHKAIDKHLDVCELASKEAHNYDHNNPDERPISVESDVVNMGSYLSAYAQTYGDEDLIERPIEYVAWGSVMWSMNRQRMGRSIGLSEAVKADLCAAEYRDSSSQHTREHGERLQHSDGHGSTLRCADCGSGWRIDQDAETIAELRLDDDRADRADRGESHGDREGFQGDDGRDLDHVDWNGVPKEPGTAGARSGAPVIALETRERIEEYVRLNGKDVSPAELMGSLDLDPSVLPWVNRILGDGDLPVKDSYDVPELTDTWQIEAFIDEEGEEHLPSSNGGVEMEPTHLPVKNVVENTRLKNCREHGGWFVRCRRCNVKRSTKVLKGASYPEIAYHMVHDHGVEKPEFADWLMNFDEPGNAELPPEMDHPEPPGEGEV